ncbi:MAG TPA: hypothetical protein VGQ86_05935 [Candidatus Limnocylindria bacterium]|nr:hypothetical protein [Candidatus Limnocylindria bacterium]
MQSRHIPKRTVGRSDLKGNSSNAFLTPHIEHVFMWCLPGLSPAQLLGGPTHVAVRAPHLTLLDFVDQAIQRRIPHEPRDFDRFPRNVIELQDTDLGLTTVDAWVGPEILEYEGLVALGVSLTIRVHIRDVSVTVLPVPGALTFPAEVLKFELGGPIERFHRLQKPAATASSSSFLS